MLLLLCFFFGGLRVSLNIALSCNKIAHHRLALFLWMFLISMARVEVGVVEHSRKGLKLIEVWYCITHEHHTHIHRPYRQHYPSGHRELNVHGAPLYGWYSAAHKRIIAWVHTLCLDGVVAVERGEGEGGKRKRHRTVLVNRKHGRRSTIAEKWYHIFTNKYSTEALTP